MHSNVLYAQQVAKLAVYRSPSSRDSLEKIYASPWEELYSESPQRKSLSPTTKKRFDKELKADIAVLSSHGMEGKTLEEIAAWCAEDERGQRREMAKRRRLGITGTCLSCVRCESCTY